ncbi:cell division protein FtsN [Phenylobacterium sp.]|uniref:cell division protein FtsN n=1 Tax=Phenylobacterium sp. TaxID=1871053 RepID=UPI002FC74B39
MSDPDRGAYAPPTDAPLSFDARQPVRGSKPAPLMLIISAIVLILLVIAIVLFYRSGVREAGAPPQTVGAPLGELKAPPPAEAQPADPAAGLQIYRAEDGPPDTAGPTFIDPPEAPQPRPEAVVIQPPPKPAPSSPVMSGPVAALPSGPALKPAIAPPPPAPAPKLAAPAPKAAAPAPKVVAVAPPPKAAAPAPKPAATAGVAAVQIGAFSSQALADKGWNDAAKVAPGAAAGKGKRVEQIQKDGSTLFRTTVTGFASRQAATDFCNQLKAAGKNCFVK